MAFARRFTRALEEEAGCANILNRQGGGVRKKRDLVAIAIIDALEYVRLTAGVRY